MVVARLLFFLSSLSLSFFLLIFIFMIMKFFSFSTGSHGCIVTFQPLNNRRGALFQHAHTSGRFWSLSHVIFFLFFVLDKTLFPFLFLGVSQWVVTQHKKMCYRPKSAIFISLQVTWWSDFRSNCFSILFKTTCLQFVCKQTKKRFVFGFLEKKFCFPMWIDKEKIFLTVTSACLTHLSGFKNLYDFRE